MSLLPRFFSPAWTRFARRLLFSLTCVFAHSPLAIYAAEPEDAPVTPSKPAALSLTVHPKVEILPLQLPWSALVTANGRLLTIDENRVKLSNNDGKTFTKGTPLHPKKVATGRPIDGRTLRTSKGTLILVYGDPKTRKLSWDRATGEPKSDMRADVWMIRSEDGGKTWTDRQEISTLLESVSPYCLSLIKITEAADGTVVVPMQLRVGNKNRSVITTVISRDDGKTWLPGKSTLDVGGAGIHDGLLEPTLVALRDGRLWMLIRTNLDKFYESFSADSGLTWSPAAPTSIAASSSPGYLLRLKSGRLMLLWNQLHPAGQPDYPRRSGKGTSAKPASWYRDELSLAFSEDDGKSWSAPVIIAHDSKRVAYPSAIERRPGEIWVTVHHTTGNTMRFREEDFIGTKPSP
ncbi:sialidase family protein [Oleiharenicola lentus]|uniref:sialidase family protein n=1 Tax=Oleiharenicola lentus TaxID=2508720 RepID=UPI003F680D52